MLTINYLPGMISLLQKTTKYQDRMGKMQNTFRVLERLRILNEAFVAMVLVIVMVCLGRLLFSGI